MKKYGKRWFSALMALLFSLIVLVPAASAATPEMADPARSLNFDGGWKFHLGDADGAQAMDYADGAWRDVTLPHDYSIEQDFTPTAQGESGYLPGGIGWYRKTFTAPVDYAGKHITLDFDGAYMNTEVYVNGTKVGTNPYGYNPFSFDITDLVRPGQKNVVAVKTNNKIPSSRWYSGSGIFRDVWLTVTNPLHIAKNGVQITTPDLAKGSGRTDVRTTVENGTSKDQTIELRQTVKNGAQKKKFRSSKYTVPAGKTRTFAMSFDVKNPKLWSPETPEVYTMTTELLVDGKPVDKVSNDYGYKWIKIDNNKGFFLNGKPLKLKGVCLHHDQGALGAVANRAAIERQIQMMKKMGCNSIRTSHNPPSAEFIDLCNKYGILVLDEMYDGWHANKNVNIHDFSESFYKEVPASDSRLVDSYTGETYAEFSLKQTMKRDRNAPAVFEWDLGNEVEGAAAGIAYDRDAKQLIQWTKEVDPTRPVTSADSMLKYYDKIEVPDHTNIADMQTEAGGMVGGNYVHGNVYDIIHKRHPNWNLVASEDASAVNSRGVYKRSKDQLPDHQLTAYDESTVSWGKMAAESWYDCITRDYISGEYVWTGFDYIGEPTPWNDVVSVPYRGWPAPKNSYFGIVDTAGLPKDSYYFYMSQWNTDVTTLHILPQWNENVVEKDTDGNVKVVVYSSAPSVELFFTPKNGGKKVSLGRKTFTKKRTAAGYTYQIYEGPGKSDKDHENLYLSWNVPYQDGTLTAVAYDADGHVIRKTEGQSTVSTTGPAAELRADIYGDRKTISADGKDLAYIEVRITDKDGLAVPDACNKITVSVDGTAVRLVGVDNGNAYDTQSYRTNNRKAFNGRFLAIVQSTGQKGKAKVTVKADGLKSDTVSIHTK